MKSKRFTLIYIIRFEYLQQTHNQVISIASNILKLVSTLLTTEQFQRSKVNKRESSLFARYTRFYGIINQNLYYFSGETGTVVFARD